MANRFITKLFDSIEKYGERNLPPAVEQRTSLENPQTPLSYPAEWLLDIFNGGRTDSGIRVSEMTALQVGTVFACVNVISDGVSSLPLHVYQRAKISGRASKTLALDSPMYKIVHTEPNPEMTSAVFFKVAMIHALLWGNSYSEIERDGSGQICGLWPRNPARTRPIRLLKPIMFEGDLLPGGTLMYETSDQLMDSSSYVVDQNPEMMNVGLRRLVLAENMVHVPGLSLDGRLGQSTVWLARQAFGLALATEKYGAKFFGNGARPSGILTFPNKMEDKQIDTARRSWAEAHGGENQFRVAVLEDGVKYTKIQATPEEGQMLETRKYEREEICAIFGVPAHMVCAQDKGGKSNVEQSSIEFVLYCLHPWLNRWEQEMERKLFSKMGRSASKYFAKFDTRKLMYPDAAARATFYASGKQWGFLNTNIILEMEDINPVEDPKVGETFWMPINMQDAGDPQKLGAEDQNTLDIKKATAVAEHGAQMAQDTAKVTTNLQMKTAQQSHEHTMAQTKVSNSHELAKHKTGIAPPAAPGAPGAPGAPAAGNDAGDQPGQAKRTITDFAEMRSAMETLMEDGFHFRKSEYDDELDGITYTYLHPDHRSVLLTYKQGPVAVDDSSVAAGTGRDNIGELFAGGDSRDKGPEGKTDYVLRHGCTKANDEDEYRGWGTYPLDADGKAEALEAAKFLRDKGLIKIVTSSLVRHQQTARIIANELDIPVETDENFRTLNVGDFTGKKRKVYGEKLQEYLDDPSKVIPGGESVDTFIKRNAGAFDKVRADSQRTLVVTSRSNIFGLIGKSTDAEVKIANPGGVYTLNNGNKLTQVLGSDATDTLAGS